MMASSYAWLPDHHVRVAATLAHVDEVIAHAADLLFDYQTQPGGNVDFAEVPAGAFSRTVVVGLAPIPPKVPLLVADALVSLRNAVEHTLYAEVEHRDGELDDQAGRLVQMPAARSYADFQRWIDGRKKNGPPALQRGSDLLRRIGGLQPFHRLKNAQDHPMALLADHTNHSKHRAPAITAVQLAAMYREDQLPRSVRDVPRGPEIPLKVGDAIAETPIGVKIPVELFPTIGLNRPGTDRWPILMQELDYLSSWVRTQAVPRLITGAEPPKPDLPARYDISIGHDDPRAAIADGTAKSAAKSHGDRLGAASVRIDMTDTIAQMPGAPSRDQIHAWWESLSDDEVINRMEHLRRTDVYDPEVVLSNYAVFESMLDDIRRFAGRGKSREL